MDHGKQHMRCTRTLRRSERRQAYNASGEISPRVFRSAALYALYSERVSSPYSDCASMGSYIHTKMST